MIEHISEMDMKKHRNTIVVCIYKTPRSDIDLFCGSIEKLFTDAMPSKSIFLCGDFNVHLLKHEKHNGPKRFLDCMYGLRLHTLIDRPRRFTINSCTLIDNILFTNQIIN